MQLWFHFLRVIVFYLLILKKKVAGSPKASVFYFPTKRRLVPVY